MERTVCLHKEPSNGLYYCTLDCPGYDMRDGKATAEEAIQLKLSRLQWPEAEVYCGYGLENKGSFMGVCRNDGTWL